MFKQAQQKTIFIVIPTGVFDGQTINFENDNDIDGNNIVSIETYNDTQLSANSAGNPIVTAAEGAAATFTIMQAKYKQVEDVPYQSFNTVLLNGIQKQFEPFTLNLTQSYVTINDASSVTAGDALAFSFYWI